MPEPMLLLAGLLVAGAAVLAPLRRRAAVPDLGDEHEASWVRHRVAIEALRDLEADRRAGSLDDATYAAQLAEAEQRAAATRAALDAPPAPDRPIIVGPGGRGGTAAVATAALVGLIFLAGSLLPGTGIANGTVVNQALAAAETAEAARQDRIADLREQLADDPLDPEPAVISDLADAYLAGSSGDDLYAAGVALQLLISVQPDRADAYERLLSAYLRAGDHVNARATLTSYADVSTADPVEVAFFDGLIALRGENDGERARAAFDRFLELAPADPRGPMIRGLRDEADELAG
jgi:hypothetical protein